MARSRLKLAVVVIFLLICLIGVRYCALNWTDVSSSGTPDGGRLQQDRPQSEQQMSQSSPSLRRGTNNWFSTQQQQHQQQRAGADGDLPHCRSIHPWGDAVVDQLEPFVAAGGITRDMIDEAWRFVRRSTTQFGDKPMEGRRVLVLNGDVYSAPFEGFGDLASEYARGDPDRTLLLILKALCRSTDPIPDMEIFIHSDDGGAIGKSAFLHAGEGDAAPFVPLFSFSVSTIEQKDLLMPYYGVYAWHRPMDFVDVPWEAKKRQCFWRGSSTGNMYTASNWRDQTRVRLVQACAKAPELCNARFAQVVQATPEAKRQMFQELGVGDNVPMEQQTRYQCVIVVDGNCAPTTRLQFLHSGTVMIKQESPEKEFFYSNLQPYVHYIPVASDLSNLLAVVNWTLSHPQYARRVAARAKRYAQRYLNDNVTTCYMTDLLARYAALFRYRLVRDVRQFPDMSRVTLSRHVHDRMSKVVGQTCPKSWLVEAGT